MLSGNPMVTDTLVTTFTRDFRFNQIFIFFTVISHGKVLFTVVNHEIKPKNT